VVRAGEALRSFRQLDHSNKHQHSLRVFVRCAASFVARRDLLLVVRSPRCWEEAMRKEGHSNDPGPKIDRFGGEDWSIAGEYVYSLLQQTKSEGAA
jgi:hypothetical protein